MISRINVKSRFTYKSKTKAEWESENPILLNGEIGFVNDVEQIDYFKIGDGVTPWNELGYKKGIKGDKGDRGADGTVAFNDLTEDQKYSLTQVDKIFEQNHRKYLKFWVGTQSEYAAVENTDENTFYIITDNDEVEDFKEVAREIAQEVSQEVITNVVDERTIDYIVEQGETVLENVKIGLDDIQTLPEGTKIFYKKWASGNFECWSNVLQLSNVQITTQSGNVYRLANIVTPLPENIGIVSVDNIGVSCSATGAMVWVGQTYVGGENCRNIVFDVVCGQSTTLNVLGYYIQAKGTWN